MKKVVIMKAVSPPAMEALISAVPSRERKSRSTNIIAVSQAWEATIQKRLIATEIEKLGIRISDDELVSFIRRNPHPSLANVFVDDQGNFDYQAYLAALGDPSADWTQLEAWARSRLPEFKLDQLGLAGTKIDS